LSFTVIANLGFGYDFDALHNPDDPFAMAYREIFQQTPGTRALNLAANFAPWLMKLPFPRVLQVARARKSIIKHATKLVRDKESKTATGQDILSLMIAENRKAEGKMAEIELVDQVMTFLLAGHETTSTAVIPVFDMLTIAGMGSAHSCAASGNSRTITQ
jgi:cytochrome P450